MLVVAFDGLLFDTLERRALAIVEALGEEGFEANADVVRQVLPSRSIAETVREAVSARSMRASSDTGAFDETSIDLAVLRAERSLSNLASRSAAVSVKLLDRIRSAAAVTRVVVRADSRRRDVDELLRLTELDSLLAMTRCSDDMSGVHRTNDESTLRRSYAQIVARMAANRNLLGNASGIGVALECSARGRDVAREFGFQVPDNPESIPIPGT